MDKIGPRAAYMSTWTFELVWVGYVFGTGTWMTINISGAAAGIFITMALRRHKHIISIFLSFTRKEYIYQCHSRVGKWLKRTYMFFTYMNCPWQGSRERERYVRRNQPIGCPADILEHLTTIHVNQYGLGYCIAWWNRLLYRLHPSQSRLDTEIAHFQQ